MRVLRRTGLVDSLARGFSSPVPRHTTTRINRRLRSTFHSNASGPLSLQRGAFRKGRERRDTEPPGQPADDGRPPGPDPDHDHRPPRPPPPAFQGSGRNQGIERDRLLKPEDVPHDLMCSICLGVVADQSSETPCGHLFHGASKFTTKKPAVPARQETLASGPVGRSESTTCPSDASGAASR